MSINFQNRLYLPGPGLVSFIHCSEIIFCFLVIDYTSKRLRLNSQNFSNMYMFTKLSKKAYFLPAPGFVSFIGYTAVRSSFSADRLIFLTAVTKFTKYFIHVPGLVSFIHCREIFSSGFLLIH